MIREPQRSYVLELLLALGPAAKEFLLAGAQAMTFTMQNPRKSFDVDFVLNVLALREIDVKVAEILGELRYVPDPKARNFQFEKAIPNSPEKMRIEFLAPPDAGQKKGELRVRIQAGVHGRACQEGIIALAESDEYELEGRLPNGKPAVARIRVVRPWALVVMKLFALDDRYGNIRGLEDRERQRQAARDQTVDVIGILSSQPDPHNFAGHFVRQFGEERTLSDKALGILGEYFGDETKPGVTLYWEEFERQQLVSREEADSRLRRALRLAARITDFMVR